MRLALCICMLMAATAGWTAALPEERVLADVNGETITVSRLLADFQQRHGGHLSLLVGEEIIRDFLDRQVEARLLAQEARRLKIDHDPRVLAELQRLERRLRTEALLEEEMEAAAEVSPDDLAAAVEALSNVYGIRWILVSTEAKARAAADRVRAGEAFEDVARDVSIAPSAEKGGDPGPFRWGGTNRELESQVLLLEPGEMSPVFPVGDDFAVVQVFERVGAETPPGPDEERRASHILRRRQQDDRIRALRQELFREAGVSIEADRLTLEELRQAASGEREAAAVARIGERNLLLSEVAGGMEFEAWATLPRERFAQEAEKTVRNAVEEMLLDEEARRRGSGGEEVELTLRAAEDLALLRILMSEFVYAKLEADDEALRAWFEEQHERFREPDRYHLQHLIVEDEKQAGSLRAELDGAGGEAFAAAAERWSLDRETAALGGDAGWLSSDQLSPVFREIVAGLRPGELSPVMATRSGFLLTRLVEMQPGADPPFEWVQAEVEAAWLADARSAARERWVERLRAVSEVSLDDSAIRAAAQELTERAKGTPDQPPPDPHGGH